MGDVVFATLVIFLREGVEASMIVAILLAYLNRIGRRDHFRDVFLGVGAALVLAAAGGAIAYQAIRSYDGSRVQTIFEAITFLVAATVLTYMTFWMRKHARSLSKELRERAGAALDGKASGGWDSWRSRPSAARGWKPSCSRWRSSSAPRQQAPSAARRSAWPG
jgi:high-affinity iron transporter